MNIQLFLDNVEIPLTNGGYKEIPLVKEERIETEAGTINRNIRRSGQGHLEVSFTADNDIKAYLDICVCADELSAKYFSENNEAVIEKTMFIDPDTYSADLIMENGENRYYSISFSLEEF